MTRDPLASCTKKKRAWGGGTPGEIIAYRKSRDNATLVCFIYQKTELISFHKSYALLSVGNVIKGNRVSKPGTKNQAIIKISY